MPQAIRKNRKALDIADFCPHDLRRTGATWITAVGLPKLYARLILLITAMATDHALYDI